MIKQVRVGIYVLIVIMIAIACGRQHKTEEELSHSGVTYYVPKIMYGINVDSLTVKQDKVKRNEFLADILLRNGIDYSVIDYIARNTKDTFDVRHIKYGNSYYLFFSKDSVPRTLYLVYDITPSSYVLYHLTDSIYAVRGEKEIVTKIDTAAGEIETSLWNALVAHQDDPNLANDLSEIYAWTIDFFGLQKGDKYKAIYETFYVDDKYTGLGKVLTADFNHSGVDLYAFYFEQNGKGDYFDTAGNSLERTFLKAPLRYSRISSRFSEGRMHPILKIRRPHHGVDYAAPEGTPVHSVGDGVIIKKGYQKRGGGNYLKIKHNGTYTTSYMHMKGFAKGMKVGKHVKQGELIGYVGHTGLATGPHLDFRFYRNGKAINPLKVESPPAKPVDTAYRAAFDSIVQKYLPLLQFPDSN